MRADELLLWLSARKEGSWQQFRQAVEEFNSAETEEGLADDHEFPLHQRLRLDLGRLGHVEFFAGGCEDGWRVAPPTLAAHSFSGKVRGVLCGARSPGLCARVARAQADLNIETVDLNAVPQVIRISASQKPALAGLAMATGLVFQEDAPLAILSNLPRCEVPSHERGHAEFPQGLDWAIRLFDLRKLAWRKVERSELKKVRFGVIQFRIYFQRWRSFLRWNGLTFEMPRAVALYVLLRHYRRNVVHYSPNSAELTVPASCRPPLLLERAMVLCSGVPPVYASAHLTYAEVLPEVAHLAGELLRQPIV